MDTSEIDFDQRVGIVYKLYNIVNDWECIDSTMIPITDVINEMTSMYYSNHPSLFYKYMREIGIENWRIKILEVKFVTKISELDNMETKCIEREGCVGKLSFKD